MLLSFLVCATPFLKCQTSYSWCDTFERGLGRPTRRYEWASSSRVRLSNTMVAAAISVPLFLGGIYFASTVQGNSASMGRPNGLLQPPVKPYCFV
jgi:hypothetical protein